MRTLFIGALAATLVGCSCPLAPQANLEVCRDASGFLCLDRTAASHPIEPEPVSFKANSATLKVKSTIAAKTEKPSGRSRYRGRARSRGEALATARRTGALPSSAHARDRAQLDTKKSKPAMIAAKVEPPVSGRPAETSDPVIIKAKATIAAKLEDPASAEFGEMNRAIRKNTLGQSIDTICGRVKGKKASGEDTGDMPFLYLVEDDDAYVVDGPPGSAAAAAYGNICN
jgi:hypothetical protein